MLQCLWNYFLFMFVVLLFKVFLLLFNCYIGGGLFDFYIDNVVCDVYGGCEWVCIDLFLIFFFSDLEDYDGGELVIQDIYVL